MEAVLFDGENPRSLMNLLPDELTKQIKNLLTSDDAKLLGLGERELEREIARKGFMVDLNDVRLRESFWREFDRMQDEDARDPKMNMTFILKGIIIKDIFYSQYIRNYHKLAYLLSPPTAYMHRLHDALNCTTEKIRAIVAAMPEKPNSFQMRWLLKANEHLHRRMYGSIVGGQKGLANQPEPEPEPEPERIPEPPAGPTPEEITRQKMNEIENAKRMIDVMKQQGKSV